MREKPVRTAFFYLIYFILDLNQTLFFLIELEQLIDRKKYFIHWSSLKYFK